MKEEIIKNIKSLQQLPDTISQIQKVCSNPESGITDMIKIVEKDPILIAHLLRAADSPLYGFSREVINITQAISLFMSTVKGFIIAVAVKNSLKINLSSYGLSEQQFLQIADLQNVFMMCWMSKANRILLALLIPASLLLETGVVVLSSVLIAQKKQDQFKMLLQNRQNFSISHTEKQMFGMSSYEISSALFEYWNFDKSLTTIIRYTEEPEAAPANLQKYTYALAILQRLISLYESCTPQQIQAAKALLNHSAFDEGLFNQVLNEFVKSITS